MSVSKTAGVSLFYVPQAIFNFLMAMNACSRIQTALEEEVSKAKCGTVIRVLNSVGVWVGGKCR